MHTFELLQFPFVHHLQVYYNQLSIDCQYPVLQGKPTSLACKKNVFYFFIVTIVKQEAFPLLWMG